MLTKWTN